jgi:hypothetical protein
MDIASGFKMHDLEADAMHEIGHLLLQEGYLWESEECYAVSYEDFQTMEHIGSHRDSSWVLLSISSGHKLYGRFASLCRGNSPWDLYTILDWKCSRRGLRPTNRPNYKPELISKAYEPYIEKMQTHPLNDGIDRTDYEEFADELELSDAGKEYQTYVADTSFDDEDPELLAEEINDEEELESPEEFMKEEAEEEEAGWPS